MLLDLPNRVVRLRLLLTAHDTAPPSAVEDGAVDTPTMPASLRRALAPYVNVIKNEETPPHF